MLIIHDKRLPKKYQTALKSKLPNACLVPFSGIEDFTTNKVYESILHHPDIYFFQLDKKTFVHAPGLRPERLRPLKDLNIKLIKGSGDPHGLYPHTVCYNAIRLGTSVFGNFSYIDSALCDTLRLKKLKLVNVAQGYASCSVLPVNDRAIITSDKGIAEAAAAEGIDVLLLSCKSVVLPGEKHGFIGGASARAADGTIILLGDLGLHPEGEIIKAFLAEHAAGYIDVEGLPLYDAGRLMIFC